MIEFRKRSDWQPLARDPTIIGRGYKRRCATRFELFVDLFEQSKPKTPEPKWSPSLEPGSAGDRRRWKTPRVPSVAATGGGRARGGGGGEGERGAGRGTDRPPTAGRTVGPSLRLWFKRP